MRKHKGAILALIGFAVLATSLVMSTPFPGSGLNETRMKRPVDLGPAETTRVETPDSPAAVVATSAPKAPPVLSVQETGPILFKEGELEAYLTFPVPVGKRMVIETVSARASVGSGQKVQLMFTATAGGSTAAFAIPMISQGSFSRQGDCFASVQSLRAFADGGTVVQFRVDRTAVGELDSGFISISGYLESR